MTSNTQISKIAKLLEESGIPVEEVKRIDKVKVGTYQTVTKDSEGNVTTHDLEANSLILTPVWSDGPKWPLVQQAAPTVIKASSDNAVKKANNMKTAVILPDPQIGFRLDARTGALDPFHDERAMEIALHIIKKLQPDIIVNLGDLLDFPSFGKYVQEAAFALTTQHTLDRGHSFLAQQKASSPNSKIVLMEGNHDRRLEKTIVLNAVSAFGLAQANKPSSWPVLSVPFLLRLDELGVEYVGAYPNGRFWINNRLACQHGDIVKGPGLTAKAVLESETVSTIHGHVHRLEMAYNTKNNRYGANTRFAFSAGCLCRVDGAVPSVKSSTDVFGRPVKRYENWQNGLAVVTYEDGDGKFTFEHVHIDEGTTIFRGEHIACKKR